MLQRNAQSHSGLHRETINLKMHRKQTTQIIGRLTLSLRHMHVQSTHDVSLKSNGSYGALWSRRGFTCDGRSILDIGRERLRSLGLHRLAKTMRVSAPYDLHT